MNHILLVSRMLDCDLWSKLALVIHLGLIEGKAYRMVNYKHEKSVLKGKGACYSGRVVRQSWIFDLVCVRC